jgi:SAM-dependent methyltransferase
MEDADAAVASLTGDRPEDWDRRYERVGRWWSGRPNGSLVAEVEHLEPGTALDVGCGEGADAIWLAQHGWRVTGLDISSVALERCRRAAADAGVEVNWGQAEVGAGTAPAVGPFDLVTVLYPSFRHAPGDPAIRWLLDAVAPGGTLLVVGHDLHGHDHGHHGIDPADYVQPDDVARLLDEGWAVEAHERRPRALPPGHPLGEVPDVILRARRS